LKRILRIYAEWRKGVDGAALLCYSKLAMEVGLFFMPKIKNWRWKLCALELPWHVQNVNNAITT